MKLLTYLPIKKKKITYYLFIRSQQCLHFEAFLINTNFSGTIGSVYREVLYWILLRTKIIIKKILVDVFSPFLGCMIYNICVVRYYLSFIILHPVNSFCTKDSHHIHFVFCICVCLNHESVLMNYKLVNFAPQ